jgi:peptide/nickel transport system substrate-binding protein
MRRRLAARLAAVSVAAALGLGACSSGDAVDTGDDEAGAGALTAAIAGEPDQLDPHKTTAYFSFQVLENVYDTLVEPDDDLKMRPALAESWTTSPDQLSWTFTLRDGVTFHDGQPLTSADVVYSFDRIIDGKLSTAYRFESVKDVVAVDPKTVRIDLTGPTPNLLANIGSFKGTAIVQKKNVDDGKIASAPVGTGPFSFESYQRGTSISLARNDGYWGGAPKLPGVKFTFVKEPGTALANLKGGQVQWTDNIPPAQVESLTSGDEPVVRSVPSNDYWYFALNQAKKPFDDPRVRQAFAWAIDREAIAQAAKFGAAEVNQTAIPETSAWYYDYAPYSQDVAKATSLLQQAGVSNLQVDLMVTSEFPETIQVAQVMKDQLAAVGVTLNIRTEDFATWLADQGAGTFDGFMLGWLGNVDPDEFYYSQHHSAGANNYQKYRNPRTDQLLDQGRRATDEAQRKGFYDQAAKQIVDDASYVYLYNPNVVQGWSGNLTGYTARADRAIRFRSAALGS